MARENWLRWGILPVLMVMVLVGLGRGSVAQTEGTAASPAATPGATPESTSALPDLSAIEPGVFYAALLAASPPADILPEGANPVQIYPWQDTNDDDLVGTLGGAIVATEDPFGSELSPAISYIVFPDEAAATERYESIAEISADDAQINPLAAFETPATYVAFPDQVLGIIRVGYVLVIASVAPSGDDAADQATIADLLATGLGFVGTVASDVAP